MTMKRVKLLNQSRPLPHPLEVAYCDSFFCRLAGLMFQSGIDPNGGLLMVQPTEDRINAAIHMFFMNFDISVVWLDHNLKVVDVQIARRWRPAYTPSRSAKYVLEIQTEQFQNFHPGDQVVLEPCG